jgi:hypothetical protein
MTLQPLLINQLQGLATQIHVQPLLIPLQIIHEKLLPVLEFLHDGHEVLGLFELYADGLGDVVQVVDVAVV